MTARISIDQLPSFTLGGVTFGRLAALHGQTRYKVTDRIGRVWLVARDGSAQYPWRCTLMVLGADMFAATLDEAAEIIGEITSDRVAAEQERGDVSRVLCTGALS